MAYNNVPVNGWPQIKDLEKLDAIAQQIADMPTFTSSDKAFLADLPAYPDTNGSKVLTATTYDGDTSLSYEEIPDELPADPQTDGTRVLTATTTSGETVKSWETMDTVKNQIYSTTPVKIGKWLDKDFYRKVVNFGALPNATVKTVGSGLTNENVINIYGTCTNGTTVLTIPNAPIFAFSEAIKMSYNNTSHEISVSCDADRSSYSAYIVLEYVNADS